MKRILVVEDEASIRELVALNLKMTGWEVLEAPSAERALELIQKNPPCDVALLDIMLPGMDGFSLCETIRHGDPYIGIIMASAKGQESDKIRGLSIGADDYITKPFSVSELMARVEALARRVRRSATADDEQAGSEPDQLVSGPFVLDEKSRVLYKSGKPIDLTQVEFQIMELFFRNPGTALVREKILEIRARLQEHVEQIVEKSEAQMAGEAGALASALAVSENSPSPEKLQEWMETIRHNR